MIKPEMSIANCNISNILYNIYLMAEVLYDRPRTEEDDYMATLLEWRTPLPVGSADIDLSEIDFTDSATEPGYAWERLPRWLYEVKETYKSTDGPIICLDLCSSTPLYAQHLRTHQFVRDGDHAKRLVGQSLDATLQNPKRPGWQEIFKPMSVALSKDTEARDLLAAALQECIYTITYDESSENSDDPITSFASRLFDKLLDQDYIFVNDDSYSDVESSWRLRIDKVIKHVSYIERIQKLQIPSELAIVARSILQDEPQDKEARQFAKDKKSINQMDALEFIAWQSINIAKLVVGNKTYRPSRYLSMDSANPTDIALSSIFNTPESTQKMNMFSHAINSLSRSYQHIQQNLFDELKFPDNSLTLITCIDGWPFHFQLDDEIHNHHEDFGEVAVNTLLGLYKKLNYGGKIIIFPWTVQSESHSEHKAAERVLESAVDEFERRTKAGVYLRRLSRDTLMSWMSLSDRQTAEKLSPIFNSKGDRFNVLQITKPHKKLEEANRRNIGKTAITNQTRG